MSELTGEQLAIAASNMRGALNTIKQMSSTQITLIALITAKAGITKMSSAMGMLAVIGEFGGVLSTMMATGDDALVEEAIDLARLLAKKSLEEQRKTRSGQPNAEAASTQEPVAEG